MTNDPTEGTRPPTSRVIPARALLFDCDGVLVDSDPSVVMAWSRWAAHYELKPADVIALVHGRRAGDTVAALIDAGRQEEALALINQYEIEDASTVRAVPGAERLLRSLPSDSWAVVTSALSGLARARIAASGLSFPSTLVTADFVSRGKPDPEGYLMAARLLNAEARDCIVIEDALEGVLAARAAQVGAVVGVGDRVMGAEIDAHVDDLTELTWTGNGLSVQSRSSRPHVS